MNENAKTSGRVIGIEEIKEMIPHRDPFLFIDRITEIVPDEYAVGIMDLTGDEPFFEGHFPGHPITPGVLIVEAMAQTSAILVIETTGKQPGKVVYFMTIDSARFRKPVFPGDTVSLRVDKHRNRGAVWKFRGEARVDDKLVAEAVFSAMIMDVDK